MEYGDERRSALHSTILFSNFISKFDLALRRQEQAKNKGHSNESQGGNALNAGRAKALLGRGVLLLHPYKQSLHTV
jgi:hypothetical protein